MNQNLIVLLNWEYHFTFDHMLINAPTTTKKNRLHSVDLRKGVLPEMYAHIKISTMLPVYAL